LQIGKQKRRKQGRKELTLRRKPVKYGDDEEHSDVIYGQNGEVSTTSIG
jgi:hypothetical protein